MEAESGVTLNTGTSDLEIHSEKSIVVKPGSTLNGGDITLLSSGQDEDSRVHLRERTTVRGQDLKIRGYYRTSVDRNSNLQLSGFIKVLTGKLNQSGQYIKEQSSKIFTSPVSQTHIGSGVILQGYHIELQSHYHLLVERNVQILGSNVINLSGRSFPWIQAFDTWNQPLRQVITLILLEVFVFQQLITQPQVQSPTPWR